MGWSARRTEALVAWLPAFGVLVLSFARLEPTPLQVMGLSQDLLPPRAIAATTIIIASALALRFIHRWPWPLFVLAPLGWMTYALAPAFIVASYHAARNFKRRALTLFLLAASLFIAVPVAVGMIRRAHSATGLLIDGFMYLTLLVLLPFGYGAWIRSRQQLSETQHQARAQKARSLERARIARELHDIVAHRVSLMVLHAGALEIAAADQRTKATAGLIRSTGREALSELRQVLDVLRGPGNAVEPQPTLADIERLVERTRSAGVPISLFMEGKQQPLPATVERTAYRVVQESLTNVVKHAGFPPTRVLLKHVEDGLEVSVENGSATGSASPIPGAGHGLIGLRERVDLLDGTFETTASADGFVVRAFLPVNGGLDDPGSDSGR